MRALEEEEEEVVVPSCLLEGQQVWTREEEVEEDSDLKRHRRRAAIRAALAQVAELLFLWEVRVVRLHLTGRLRLAAMAHRHLDPTRRLAEARAGGGSQTPNFGGGNTSMGLGGGGQANAGASSARKPTRRNGRRR